MTSTLSEISTEKWVMWTDLNYPLKNQKLTAQGENMGIFNSLEKAERFKIRNLFYTYRL